jgi:cyanate permease
VGWGGLLTAVLGPPLVGTLLDATGSFAAGFLAFAAIVVVVLAASSLIRPFDLVTAEPATTDIGGVRASP